MDREARSRSTADLLVLVDSAEFDEAAALEVLRSPFCTPEVAAKVADSRRLLGSHRIRELLCSVRGMPVSRVTDLLATLPWLSLLQLAQAPNTPPVIRRHAERRLLYKLPKLTLGEKIALARRAHRNLFQKIVAVGDSTVLEALLDNPRLTEVDLQILLAQGKPQTEVFLALIRNPRWSRQRAVRLAIARNKGAPLPIALSAMAQLGAAELDEIAKDPTVDEKIRNAATALRDRERAE